MMFHKFTKRELFGNIYFKEHMNTLGALWVIIPAQNLLFKSTLHGYISILPQIGREEKGKKGKKVIGRKEEEGEGREIVGPTRTFC